MNFYCTLFDSNYLTRGLAMYDSLIRTNEDFCLYIFAFDDLAGEIIVTLDLSHIKVIPLSEFETKELLEIKQTRTTGEYCWTCTSFSILHILEHYPVSEVTYLDADLYFFSAPQVLLDEFHESGKDVMITEHRYTREYDQRETSGIYCVQFMTFKNNENGLRVLRWWKDCCAEWCYNRLEDGKFGDQKYLDDWTERFTCVYVMESLGGGVAPWNVQQYEIGDGPSVNGKPVVFYHFHALKWLGIHRFDLSTYKLSKNIIRYLYEPYIIALQGSLDVVRTHYQVDFYRGFSSKSRGFLNFLRKIKQYVLRKLGGKYYVIRR